MRKAWIAAAAAMSMLSQPVLAAEAFRDTGAQEQRSGAFAGLSFNVPLGSREAAKPSARLQLTTTHQYRSASSFRSVRAEGIEIGLTGKGDADLYVGGARLADTDKKLGLTGLDDWILPVALLGAVVVGVILLTGGDDDLPEAQQ